MAGTEFVEFQYEGDTYYVDQTDFTVRRLRQGKNWFGPEYGKYLRVISLFVEGDADAVAFVVWMGLEKVGKAKQDPRHMDFSIHEVISAKSQDEIVDDAVATVDAVEPEMDDAGNPTSPVLSGTESSSSV